MTARAAAATSFAPRILGVDPGSAATGFGVVTCLRDGRLAYVEAGVLRPKAATFEGRLAAIYEGLTRIIEAHRPDEIALEDIFYAANVKSALKLGHARGVALLAAAHARVPVSQYSPMEVKRALVGYGRAEKDQVSRMVCVLLGMAEAPPSLDASDALAIAICHAHASRIKTLARS